jgi:hypothetical protein
MSLQDEIDAEIRIMLLDAGATAPELSPALVVLSPQAASELRRDPDWRQQLNHTSFGPTYLGAHTYEHEGAASPWRVLHAAEAESFLRQEEGLGKHDGRLRKKFTEQLRRL